MVARFCLGPWTRVSLGLTVLLVLVFPFSKSFATENIWQSTFGQRWFYEVRSWPNQVLAGTWWESSLTPGNTYNITFNVNNLRGKVGLLVGDNPAVIVDRKGLHSFDFHVSEGGKRRIIFRSRSDNVMAAVNQISVTRRTTGNSWSGGNWIPKGHYISFARERNLESEVLDPLAAPWKFNDYQVRVARDLEDALETPGVKGLWMHIDWRTLEVGDGVYDWRLLDANIAAARRYGLKFIVKVGDRSFDGANILPKYFPSQYVLWSSNHRLWGVVAKRWDPWVYNRLIRLHKAIANRYAGNPAFGGIATAETATGNFSGGDYSVSKYRNALTQVVTQTQAALKTGRLFFYLNFFRGGMNIDMNKDERVKLLSNVPHDALVVGGPDITPDVRGMPGSVTNYRIHARKTLPWVRQFCHLQHVDQGFQGINVKTNKYRQQYYDQVASVREWQSQTWFSGTPAAFEFDDLRTPNGNRVKLHPSWLVGELWRPWELLEYGVRNFDCDYVIWHYRTWGGPNEFGWDQVSWVIAHNQYFYQN